MMNLILRSPQSLLAPLALLFAVFGLAACGGGSSSGTGADGPADPDAVKQEQPPLYFSQSHVTMNYGDTPAHNRLLGGAGEGPLTFASSDASVAAVNELTGRLDIRKAGEVTISADKAADANNFSAQASYLLTVLGAAQEPLLFSHVNIEQFIDETPATNNLTGGSGSATTVFSSSDPTIVEVDPLSGSLSFMDDGSVVITATRAADERYSEATASYTVTVSKYPQEPISFSLDSVEGIVGFTADENDVTGGTGDGKIVFTSADESIASVDTESGVVTLLESGTTTITATKLDDEYYAATSASYEISAFNIIEGLKIEVGINDTQIQWQDQYGTINVQRSRFANCDPSVLSGCFDFDLQAFENATETPYSDTYAQLEQTAYLLFRNATYQSEPHFIEAVEQSFLPISNNTLVAAESTFWSFGGQDAQGTATDVIWASTDGIEWQQAPVTLPIAASQLNATIFNDSVYLAGGYSGDYLHTIWQLSATGLSQVAAPEIASDTSSHLTVFNESLWLISSAGIWQSTNGSDWNLLTDTPAFSARNDFTLFTHGDNLYLLGGQSLDGSDSLLQDIWYTSDGSDWQLLSASAEFPAQARAKVIQYNGILYLLAGDTGAENASVYSSTDANTWTLAGSADIGDLTGAAVTVDSDGIALTSAQSSYFWRSQDAMTWRTPVNAELQWLER